MLVFVEFVCTLCCILNTKMIFYSQKIDYCLYNVYAKKNCKKDDFLWFFGGIGAI